MSAQIHVDTPNVGPPGARRTPIADAIRGRWLDPASNLDRLTEIFPAPVKTAKALAAEIGVDPSNKENTLPPFNETEIEDPELLTSAAAEIYRMRRARDRQMPASLVGEPAWDILLALYAEAPDKLPVSSVVYASGVPPTTGLRWIATLTRDGLVERTPHPKDQRVIQLSLTAEGRLVLERSLRAMLRVGAR